MYILNGLQNQFEKLFLNFIDHESQRYVDDETKKFKKALQYTFSKNLNSICIKSFADFK